MAAVLFQVPYQCVVVAGTPVPYAQLYFYQTGTLTKLPVYTNSGLSAAHANPVRSNGSGGLPDIYLDNTKTYRLRILDRNGVLVEGGDIDPFIPGTVPSAGVLQPYANAAAASAAASSASASTAGTHATNAGNSAAAAASSATAASTNGAVQVALAAAQATNAAASANAADASADIAVNAASSISDIVTNVPNATAHATNRAAMAILGTNSPAYLRERNREGSFVWDSSDLSDFVTVDTEQGMFVAPAADPSGASGAWVRKFDGPANALWFVGDDPTASGTGAKIVAAANLLIALRNSQTSTFKGVTALYCPGGFGEYNFGSTTYTPLGPVHIYGDYGGGGDPAQGTVFKWTGDVAGIVLNGWNGTSQQANGSSIHNIYFKGPNVLASGPGNNSHAISFGGDCRISDIFVDGFSGDAVNGYANFSANAGNLNGSYLSNIRSVNCRWNINLSGPDANGCTIVHPYGLANHLGNVLDSSFLGNTIVGGLAEVCGPSTILHSRCSHGGYIYVVAFGQEAWCSANAPSGTTANNTGWLYLQAGAPSSTAPAWSAAQTWYFSSSLAFTSAAGIGSSVGMYFEPGMNPPIIGGYSQFNPAHYDGTPLTPTGGQANWVRMRSGGFTVEGMTCNGLINNGTSTLNGNITVPGSWQAFTAGTYRCQLRADPSTGDFDFYNYESGANNYAKGVFRFNVTDFIYDISGAKAATISSSGLRIQVGSIGYGTGTGGTVTQATSKATGVTLNKAAGQITMNNAALAAAAKVSFVVTNSVVAATDTVVVSVASGGTANAYRAAVTAVGAGSFVITVENITGGSLGEAPVVNFAVIKGASS